MSTDAAHTRTTVIPGMRYHDAPTAIEWLCKAFGFERRLVVPGENGTVAHAQLVLGDGMIMLGSADPEHAFGRLMRVPKDIGGSNTQSAYVVVDDVDAHYARAKAAGAEIVLDIEDKEYGGRGYTCRDPEGHFWSFGNYDPWKH